MYEDENYGFGNSNKLFNDPMDFSPLEMPAFSKPSKNENVQLITNGSKTVIQLSIDQLHQVLSNSKNEVSPPNSWVSTFEDPTPTRDEYSYSQKLANDNYWEFHGYGDYRLPKNSIKRPIDHHIIERRYRQNLNDKILNLKNLVMSSSTKVSKGAILDEAASTIMNLRNTVKQLKSQVNSLKSASSVNPSFYDSSINSPNLRTSDFNFADCRKTAYCFMALIIFLLNPFSYFIQSGSDFVSSFSAFFNHGNPYQTRSLLSHAHVVDGGSFLAITKSLLLLVLSYILNIGCLFVFFVNFVVQILPRTDDMNDASLYLRKAREAIERGCLREGEDYINASLTCLGITTPTKYVLKLFRFVLSLLYVTLAYIFGPLLLQYPSFCRFLVFSRKDYNDFTEYMRLLSQVYLLHNVMILKRGIVDILDDVRYVINGVAAATLSGDSSLVVELYSLAVLIFLPRAQFRQIAIRLMSRAVSIADSETTRLLVRLVEDLYTCQSLDFEDYSSLNDFKSVIFVHYIDNQLVESLNTPDYASLVELKDTIGRIQDTCDPSLDEILEYRLSVISMMLYRIGRKRARPATEKAMIPLDDPIMACAELLSVVESRLHTCELSRLPEIIATCEEVNVRLRGFDLSCDGRLERNILVYLWGWLLSLRYDLLKYVGCVSSVSPHLFSMFECDFVELVEYSSDPRHLEMIASYSRLWINI